jgi:hypothetical protein
MRSLGGALKLAFVGFWIRVTKTVAAQLSDATEAHVLFGRCVTAGVNGRAGPGDPSFKCNYVIRPRRGGAHEAAAVDSWGIWITPLGK